MSLRIIFLFMVFCGLQHTSEAAPQVMKMWLWMCTVNACYEMNDILNGTMMLSDHDPCAGQTYCTLKPGDYPQEYYDEMFKGKITEPIFRPIPETHNEPIGRFGIDPDQMNDCESTAWYTPVYSVRKTPNDKWRKVIQSEKSNFLQVVRLEICDNTGGRCFVPFKVPDSKDFDVQCVQGYNHYTFLVDDEKGGTEKLAHKLPICCFCNYLVD